MIEHILTNLSHADTELLTLLSVKLKPIFTTPPLPSLATISPSISEPLPTIAVIDLYFSLISKISKVCFLSKLSFIES